MVSSIAPFTNMALVPVETLLSTVLLNHTLIWPLELDAVAIALIAENEVSLVALTLAACT